MRGSLVVAAGALLAVGAGVGVEAAVAPPSYGPPGQQFTAAFPVAPRSCSAKAGAARFWAWTATEGVTELTVDVYEPGPTESTAGDETALASRCHRFMRGAWVGYAPLAAPRATIALAGRRVPLLELWGVADGRRAYVALASARTGSADWGVTATGRRAVVLAFLASLRSGG